MNASFATISRINHLILLLGLFSVSITAQIETKRINPESFRDYVKFHSDSYERKITMPPVDAAKLRREDIKEVGRPMRFGKALEVNLSLEDGFWEETVLGRIWKLKIHSPGAFSINLKFDRFHLPDKAELYLYNEERTMVMGPITSKLNKEGKGLATDLIEGNTIILELFEPTSHRGEVDLHINRIVHAYKDLFNAEYVGPGYGYSAPCHNDVNCAQGNNWQDEAASVAMILLGDGTRICSAGLINNACEDFTPNILTAFHCADTDNNRFLAAGEITDIENDWVFRFQYMSPTCSGADDTDFFSFNGATLRVANEPADALLIELDDLPDGSTGVNLAGWNRGLAAATSSVGIHHPRGDVMKISIEDDPATAVSFGGGPNNYWRVTFDDGTVEPGSSGSPLFDQNHRVVGQLRGNQNNICANIDNNNCFCTQPRVGEYGRLSTSWAGGFDVWLTNAPAVVTTDLISIPFIPEPTDIVICTTNRTLNLDNAPPAATHDVAWSTTSNLTIISSGQDFVTVRYAGSGNGIGTITATVTNDNTVLCPVSRAFTRDVQAGPFSPSQISVSGTTGVCQGTEYTYTANMDFGPRAGYTYSWTFPNNWIFVSQNGNTVKLRTPYSTTPDGGAVRVSINNGCGASGFSGITVYPIGCGGYYKVANQSFSEEAFRYYPNPNSGVLTIEKYHPTIDIGSYSIELYDCTGKKLTTINTSDDRFNLSTKDYPDGNYVLKIISEYGILTRRIVVVKE